MGYSLGDDKNSFDVYDNTNKVLEKVGNKLLEKVGVLIIKIIVLLKEIGH